MTQTLPHTTTLSHGIHVIDTGFHREAFDAAYLMVEDGRAAFVDTGTNFAVPRLLGALQALGLAPEAVDWLVVTHVHLDHAGGAGLLMQSLPNATLVVHPRGARHMVDPSALYAGALAVYGEAEMARSYGQLVPVAAERVRAVADGERLALAGRSLQFIDTPGHARHHHGIWDERSRGVFTGDTFGLSYREFDTGSGAFILPTTTPVQFEPQPLRESIARLLALQPQWVYLTHYGRVGDVPRLGRSLLAQIDEIVEVARAAPPGSGRHEALKVALARRLLDRLAVHGWSGGDDLALRLLAIDIELNAQGLGVWLDRAG